MSSLFRLADPPCELVTDGDSIGHLKGIRRGGGPAEFADVLLLPIVKKSYKDAVLKEARKLEGREK
jgi:hypothetical protein